MSEEISSSSGNVSIDLRFSPDEAAILQMRADLMASLRKFIKAKELTQARAAEILGVSQSRVLTSIEVDGRHSVLKCLLLLQQEPACVSVSEQRHREGLTAILNIAFRSVSQPSYHY